MTKNKACLLLTGALLLAVSVARAQSPQQLIQEVVNTEHSADESDHSQWIYLEEIRKPGEQLLQWVASTDQGNVNRILLKNGQRLSASQQRDLIQSFLQNRRAQRKQLFESNHDNQQIENLLELLPVAFVWTQTGATATTTSLHFAPAPRFHPPTRAARVFSSMTGDVVVDNQQHRICSMSGHLMRDVTFGAGLLGRLKQGSSFSLTQQQIGPSLWELTAFHIQLEGTALLFKSVSLHQDDKRAAFEPESPAVTLNRAATQVMTRPDTINF